jgi:hypothetical protein
VVRLAVDSAAALPVAVARQAVGKAICATVVLLLWVVAMAR